MMLKASHVGMELNSAFDERPRGISLCDMILRKPFGSPCNLERSEAAQEVVHW